MESRMLTAADVVTEICRDMNYSRSHVQNILRRNAERLQARQSGRRWRLPANRVKRLKKLVKVESGRRYKLGERGPRL